MLEFYVVIASSCVTGIMLLLKVCYNHKYNFYGSIFCTTIIINQHKKMMMNQLIKYRSRSLIRFSNNQVIKF